MNKREANKVAQQVGACFDTYFKNAYTVHAGKHWKARRPDDADDIARNTISAKCNVGKATDNKRGTFTFRVGVSVGEPRFVEPRFSISFIDMELRKLFTGVMSPVSQQVDLRKGELYMSYYSIDTGQHYHFNFRLDNKTKNK